MSAVYRNPKPMNSLEAHIEWLLSEGVRTSQVDAASSPYGRPDKSGAVFGHAAVRLCFRTGASLSGVHIVLEHGLERLFASFGVRDAGDPCKGDERF
jgi:hypothetical protein